MLKIISFYLECDNLPEVAYATLTQDSTMRGLHARISYECGNGLIIRGDPSVTCKIGLKWSKVKFRCGSKLNVIRILV